MDKISLFHSKNQMENKFADIKPGWSIRVHQKIKEGDKTRVQAFDGIVIARKHGNEKGGTITVRKILGGIGIEKIFPIYLPAIEKVEIIRKARVRRAKIYYLRQKSSKEIRRKIKTRTV